MNKNLYIVLLMVIFPFMVSKSYAEFSFPHKIKSFLNRNKSEIIDQKEISAECINSVSLTNINGSITIKTGPKKSLFVRTIKRTQKSTIDSLEIDMETINNNHLAITTKNNNKKNKGYVDYELIVPASLNIALTLTGTGNVLIKDVQGAIDVVANDNITIVNTKKLASLQTLKKGSITIIDAHGPIEAYTHKGTIIAENVTHNFDGRSTKGKMNISYKNVPATSTINLTTYSGNIMLALPTETNAKICGQTAHGTFMSDHEIILSSYSTKLDKNAWTYFTKHVDGILGTGGASIHLNSSSGNIKIVETMAS